MCNILSGRNIMIVTFFIGTCTRLDAVVYDYLNEDENQKKCTLMKEFNNSKTFKNRFHVISEVIDHDKMQIAFESFLTETHWIYTEEHRALGE